ncbi:phosphoglycerate kinase [Candidatus Bathyarchaeota archaeon]|nr:phosphoglycerate kinase [Candidatus Bathyarchaeota archaeon]
MNGTEFHFLTLDDVKTSGRTVFVRVDMNSPLDPSGKKILDDTRIRMTRETLERLKDAKVVVGSHQGRPGDEDFTSLEAHARLLQKYVSQPVKFVEDVIGPEARNQTKSLRVGEILVLDNLRLCSEENVSAPPDVLEKTIMVQRLAGLLDVYVNDAFATAHRLQASIVGLPRVVQAVAGKLMAKELEALKQAYHDPRRPSVYVLGGAKAEDKLLIIENILGARKADRVLVGGVVANVFLRASGVDFGEAENRKLEKSPALLEKARAILSKYKDKIILPTDLAVVRDGKRLDISLRQGKGEGVRDIGKETASEYAKVIKGAKTVVSSGPLGVFEEKEFDLGSKTVLEAMAGQDAFTVVGGGHMGSYASMLGLDQRLSHVSTAGGAMLTFLAGEELPGVRALVEAANRKKATQ